MVAIIVLLTAASLFAVAALFLNNQARADGITASPSTSAYASPSSSPEVSPTPTPTTTDTATPTPTPSATSTPPPPPVDPDDAKRYCAAAQKYQKKANAQRLELVKRCSAFQEHAPDRLKPRRAFETWKARRDYYKTKFIAFRDKNQAYWKRMVTRPHKLCHPHTEGVERWLPLLRYCGMPPSQMWHAVKVMRRESHGDSWAKNPSSTASGLFQFLADWWRGKWDPFDPLQNVRHFVGAIKKPGGWGHWGERATSDVSPFMLLLPQFHMKP